MSGFVIIMFDHLEITSSHPSIFFEFSSAILFAYCASSFKELKIDKSTVLLQSQSKRAFACSCPIELSLAGTNMSFSKLSKNVSCNSGDSSNICSNSSNMSDDDSSNCNPMFWYLRNVNRVKIGNGALEVVRSRSCALGRALEVARGCVSLRWSCVSILPFWVFPYLPPASTFPTLSPSLCNERTQTERLYIKDWYNFF